MVLLRLGGFLPRGCPGLTSVTAKTKAERHDGAPGEYTPEICQSHPQTHAAHSRNSPSCHAAHPCFSSPCFSNPGFSNPRCPDRASQRGRWIRCDGMDQPFEARRIPQPDRCRYTLRDGPTDAQSDLFTLDGRPRAASWSTANHPGTPTRTCETGQARRLCIIPRHTHSTLS